MCPSRIFNLLIIIVLLATMVYSMNHLIQAISKPSEITNDHLPLASRNKIFNWVTISIRLLVFGVLLLFVTSVITGYSAPGKLAFMIINIPLSLIGIKFEVA